VVKVQATRGAEAVRLSHAAGFYGSHAELVAQLEPLAEGARERREPLVVGVRPITEQALRHLLGDTVELVTLAQPDGADPGSGQTVASRRARQLRKLTEGGTRAVTAITEHISRFDGPDGSFWTELDAAMNVALSGLPVTLTCFFPELPLHQRILDGARSNHEQLLVDGVLRSNSGYRAPREVLAHQPAAAPDVLGPPDVSLQFGAWQLHEVRARVQQALLAAGCQLNHAEDVVLAVNEVATNAVEHGESEVELYLWTGDELVCEVHDRGILADPLPGLQAPHPSHPKGRGLWIARQLCDMLHIWSDASGTHVRMRTTR
jgi:anti-sigma regulatory factor (Ser/Thr protein kinase)